MTDRTKGSEDVSRIAPAEIRRLAFGVRYETQLRLLDNIGSVVDEVLRADGTAFGPEMFPFTEANPLEHRLVNRETGAVLRINSQDTILQLPLDTRNASRVNQWGKNFQEYVLKPLRKIGRVRHIARYGVLLHLKEDKVSSLRNPPVARYLSSDFPSANSLVLRFSRRLPAPEALAMKRVEDFRNAIYAVQQSEEGEVQISIDYQEYFRPLLDVGEWDERPFSRFVDRGLEYLEAEFQKWFQKFLRVSEVA